MTLKFNANEKITLEFSLIENKVNTESRIRYYTDKLNASNSIADVRKATLQLAVQKEKLDSITNLLNKL
jgi:hypothetical protein|tara:strand:+ start:423 stop:629 length:207 start_codon:yes stop_codon:yes gene_type:complete